MICERVQYVTDDGRVFDNRKDALRHESMGNAIALGVKYIETLGPLPTERNQQLLEDISGFITWKWNANYPQE